MAYTRLVSLALAIAAISCGGKVENDAAKKINADAGTADSSTPDAFGTDGAVLCDAAGQCTDPTLPNGSPCLQPSECISTWCSDGVCCESSCAGTCLACSSEKTGAPAGSCVPIKDGIDPDTECAPATCEAGQATAAWTCDGHGACASGAVSSCANYVCGADACKTSCGSESDCAPDFHCSAAGACEHGACLWNAKAGPSSGNAVGAVVAIDSSSSALVGGSLRGNVDVGCGAMSTDTYFQSVLVAKFTPNGDCVWSKAFQSQSASTTATAIGVDTEDNVLVAGAFQGTLDLGCGALTSLTTPGLGMRADIFVAKLSPAGACLWSKRFGGADSDYPVDIAADSSGEILLAGEFYSESLDIGCGPLLASTAFLANGMPFIARLDTNGNCLWNRGASTSSAAFVAHAALDNDDDVVALMTYSGTMDLGCGPLITDVWFNGVVVKFDPKGNCLWAHEAGSASGPQFGTGLAVDSNDNIFASGQFKTALDFGCAPITVGDSASFIAEFDSAGQCVWLKRGGGGAVAADASGNVFLSGTPDASGEFGCGPSPAETLMYVAKLDAFGTCVWSHTDADGVVNGIAADSNNAVVTGLFSGTFDIGCGATQAPNGSFLLAKFSP